MLRLGIAYAALAFSQPAAATAAEEGTSLNFCSLVHEIVDDAPHGFRKFWGASDAFFEGEIHRSRLILPNARSCEIGALGFLCMWPADPTDWGNTVVQAQNLGEAVAQCEHLNFIDQGVEESRTTQGNRHDWKAVIDTLYSRVRIRVAASNYYAERVSTGKIERKAYISLSFMRR